MGIPNALGNENVGDFLVEKMKKAEAFEPPLFS